MSAPALPATGMRATTARFAECLLLGVVTTVASLGVLTAGPALAAAARVVREWEAGDQPPIVATFVATLRTHTVGLLLPQLALLGALAVTYVDLRVAGAGLPGAWLVRMVVAGCGAFAVASFLVMFPTQARRGGGWWQAWAGAARLCVRRPWLPVAVLASTAGTGLLVAAAPATVVLAAGPLMLAVGVLVTRADGGRPDGAGEAERR